MGVYCVLSTHLSTWGRVVQGAYSFRISYHSLSAPPLTLATATRAPTNFAQSPPDSVLSRAGAPCFLSWGFSDPCATLRCRGINPLVGGHLWAKEPAAEVYRLLSLPLTEF